MSFFSRNTLIMCPVLALYTFYPFFTGKTCQPSFLTYNAQSIIIIFWGGRGYGS